MFFYRSDSASAETGKSRKAGRPVSGFTLIEILVALTVFAVLVSIALGALKFVLAKTDSMKESLQIYEEARICLDRLSTDLRSVYVSVAPAYKIPGINDDPDPYRFFYEAPQMADTRLTFTAFSHLPLGGGIPAMAASITYYLQEAGDGAWVLMRRDEALKTESSTDRFSDKAGWGTDPVLCRDLKTFTITCYDQDGKEYDAWDSDSRNFSYATPVAVRIRMEIESAHVGHRFETTVALPVFREKIANAL